jgi:multidrug efflux pump subunit AcrA (membrane-fusion protein)
VVQIHAPVGGIISQIHVEDGSVVQEGQRIAELTSSTLESEILKNQHLLTEIEAHLKRLKS